MLRDVCDRWWMLLVRGICALLFGLGALVWPAVTLLVLMILFGAFTFSDGIMGVLLGVSGKKDGRVWWEMIALGVLAIIAGLAALVWPGLALAVLITIAAASAIVRGVFEILAAIKLRKEMEGEWMLGLSGAASIGFGILLLAYPNASAMAFAFVIGMYMSALGVMAIALSLRLRSLKSRFEKDVLPGA